MITHVRFQTSVVIGGVDKIEWSATNPAATALAGAITARVGNADHGESRDSIVFECRIGKDSYNIEVPKSLSPRQDELLRQLAEQEHVEVSPHRKSFFEKLREYFGES